MNTLAKAREIARRLPNRRPARVLFASLYSTNRNDEEWNDAWEAAWLPDDLSGKTRAPWETDVNFLSPSPTPSPSPSSEEVTVAADAETKAFVEEMNENWEERRKGKGKVKEKEELYNLDSIKRDYRVRKQRAHAGLWAREIEKMQEQLVEEQGGGASLDSDIDRLFHSCSGIFDDAAAAANGDLDDEDDSSKFPSSSEFKNKPDGWETTSKDKDGSIWEMTQREEDILLQEFDRRIAYCKFQIASFIKSHIFSRRRPVDGWKYMIEVVGPNAKKGKGSVARIPALSDASTQPFQEERISIDSNTKPFRRG